MIKSTFSSATRTTSKTAQVASDIGRRIILGEYAVETSLPREPELLAEFGVSRPVLREAIKTLESKGVLESRQQRGITVLPRDRWNFLDVDILGWIMHTRADPDMLIRLTEVRMIIEPGACLLVASSGTELGLRRIEDALYRMERHVDDDKRYVEADCDFHIAILRASGNEYLASFGTVISAALMCSLEHTNLIDNNVNSLAWHARILDALHKKNGVLAARESRKQLKAALLLLVMGR